MSSKLVRLLACPVALAAVHCSDDDAGTDTAIVDAPVVEAPADAAAPDALSERGDGPPEAPDGLSAGAFWLEHPWRWEGCTLWEPLPPRNAQKLIVSDNSILFFGELGAGLFSIGAYRVTGGTWSLSLPPGGAPNLRRNFTDAASTRGRLALIERRHDGAGQSSVHVLLGDTTWTEVTPPGLTATPHTIAFGPEGDLFLASNASVLRRRGSAWQTLPGGGRLQSSLWGTPERLYQGYAMGVRVFDGASWTEVTFPAGVWPCSALGLDGGEVYALCGTTLFWLDGSTARPTTAPSCPGGETYWGTWGADLVIGNSCDMAATTSFWRGRRDSWTPLPGLAMSARPQNVSLGTPTLAGAGDTLYALARSGVWALRGGQWQPGAEMVPPGGAVSGSTDGALYAGGANGLFRLGGDGRSWEVLPGTSDLDVVSLWPSPDGTVFFAHRVPRQSATIGRWSAGTVHRDVEVPHVPMPRDYSDNVPVSRFAGTSADRVAVSVGGFRHTWNGMAWTKGEAMCHSDLVTVGPEVLLAACGSPPARPGAEHSPTPYPFELDGALVQIGSGAGSSGMALIAGAVGYARLRDATGWTSIDLDLPGGNAAWFFGAGPDMLHLTFYGRSGFARAIDRVPEAPRWNPLVPLPTSGTGFWSDGRRVAIANGAGPLRVQTGSVAVCDLGPW